MPKDSSKREQVKLRDLAREYTAKGYRVVLKPSHEQLPRFMRSVNWQPDLIAFGEDRNLVIEVASRETFADKEKLKYAVDLVEAQEDWDFVLVVSNPRKSENDELERVVPDPVHVLERLDQAEHLLSAGSAGEFVEAALLMAWAGFEAVLRHSLSRLYDRGKPQPHASLLRDAAMYGVITRRDRQSVELAMETRNAVAHGYHVLPVEIRRVRQLIRLGRKILLETEEQLPPQDD